VYSQRRVRSSSVLALLMLIQTCTGPFLGPLCTRASPSLADGEWCFSKRLRRRERRRGCEPRHTMAQGWARVTLSLLVLQLAAGSARVSQGREQGEGEGAALEAATETTIALQGAEAAAQEAQVADGERAGRRCGVAPRAPAPCTPAPLHPAPHTAACTCTSHTRHPHQGLAGFRLGTEGAYAACSRRIPNLKRPREDCPRICAMCRWWCLVP